MPYALTKICAGGVARQQHAALSVCRRQTGERGYPRRAGEPVSEQAGKRGSDFGGTHPLSGAPGVRELDDDLEVVRTPRVYSAAASLSSERVRSCLDTRGIIASSCSSVTVDQS